MIYSLETIPLQVILKNFHFDNIEAHTIDALQIVLSTVTTLTIENLTFTNVHSEFDFSIIDRIGSVNITNLIVSNCSFENAGLMRISVEQLEINNASFSEISGTDIGSDNILSITTSTSLQISGFTVSNIVISQFESFWRLDSSGSGSSTILNADLSNITLENEIKFFEIVKISNLLIENFTLNDIKTSDTSDVSNTVFNLESMASNIDSNYVISTIAYAESTVSLIRVSNKDQSDSITQNMTITDVTVSDCYLEFNDDFINFDQVQSKSVLNINMARLHFENITYIRNGNLMNFKHQTNEPMIINDTSIYNVTFGGINIEASDFDSNNTQSKVKFYNITTNYNNGEDRSLIQILDRGEVEIYNSSFVQTTNVISGPVIKAGYQQAVVSIYDSFFTNNTSDQGSVFISESQSGIKLYNCNITNNFAIGSGVIKVDRDGYFEFYGWNIYQNYAFYASVTEIYSTQIESIIDSSTITQNLVLNKDEIMNDFINRDHVQDAFRYYVTNNSNLLDQAVSREAIQILIGILKIQNDTLITSQDYALYSIYSVLTVDGLLLNDNNITTSMIIVSETTLNINNLSINNTSITDSSLSYLEVSYWEFDIYDIQFKQSNFPLLNIYYSQGNISMINSNDLVLEYLINIRSSTIHNIQNLSFENMDISLVALFNIIDSQIDQILNISASNINNTVISIDNSNITTLNTLSVDTSKIAVQIENSEISSLTNWSITNWGAENNIQSAGLDIVMSNVTITDSNFSNNIGVQGSAISISCSIGHTCQTTINDWYFSNNTASSSGGAIRYNLQRPEMNNNTFENNTAAYGPNIASYAVKIVNTGTNQTTIEIDNVGSGVKYENSINVSLVDIDDQVMSLDNESTVRVSPVSSPSRISGTNFAKFTNGMAILDYLEFIHQPGTENVEFEMYSQSLDFDQVKNGLNLTDDQLQQFRSNIMVAFRYWKPGEVILGNTECTTCSPGTYSFNWNSTEWKLWMDDASCLGGTEIDVNDGYWRKSQNSTTIVRCINDEACKGGYAPENQYPVNWAEGYSGYLWATCQIINNTKYELAGNFQCQKCPDATLNSIRVAGFLILVWIFLSGIIIVNIRKKVENEFSILLRIFANYIQLVTLSLSFGITMPSDFADIFNQSSSVGSPNQSFLSFDWFIEDYEIKAFAPNNTIFKLFLFGLLPLGLIIIIWILIVLLKWFRIWNVKFKFDTRRYIVISIICIVFLLHPSLSLESLRIFEWVEVDDNDSKMKVYMEYDWFSFDHIYWALVIALPIIIVWVIAMPVIALIILIKFRNRLDDDNVKRYMLIIYQGLDRHVFYWEFVNSLRKFLMLCCVVFLSNSSTNYQIITAISKYLDKLTFYSNFDNFIKNSDTSQAI